MARAGLFSELAVGWPTTGRVIGNPPKTDELSGTALAAPSVSVGGEYFGVEVSVE